MQEPERRRVARELRQAATRSEELLWEALRGRRFRGWKFRRQHPVGAFVVDFYCHRARLAVEVDGGVHDVAAVLLRDVERERAIESEGIGVLRVRAEDVEHNLDAVLEVIEEAVGRGLRR